jgi:hypothetical protein
VGMSEGGGADDGFTPEQKEILEIQHEILNEAGGRIAKDLGRSLSIISEMVFVRTARFIMEFIQNAEDSLIGADYDGEMEIVVSDKMVKVIHNGKPFDRADLNAICGVRSTKKPERGTLGYLGIGFKSVFKITDCPQIFSGGYAFKFDKSYWEGKDENAKALWPIIPIPISLKDVTESIPPDKTTFILPFRSKESYEVVREELKRLGPHLFMFLKKLRRLTIIDEVTGVKKLFEWDTILLEKLSSEPEIEVKNIKVKENGKERRFIVFSGIFKVPENVKADRFTQDALRAGAVAREVSIAFPLDEKGERLVELEKIGWVYGGIYSFLPLEEAVSGAPFLIQGDFVVQPGREAMNYEAVWNRWMMECVGVVASQAIEYFCKNRNFCTHYIPFFEIRKGQGDFYNKLIEPTLKRKLYEKLKDPYVPSYDGTIIPLSKAVKITEEVEGFIQEGLLRKDDLHIIFNEEGLNFIGKDVKTGELSVRQVRLKMLHRKELIEKKLKEGVGIDFLAKLYRESDKRSEFYSIPDYNVGRWFVIDREGAINHADSTYFSSLPKEVEELLEEVPEARAALGMYKFVHPKLEAMVRDLLEKARVKNIDYKEICEKFVVPKLTTRNPKPISGDAKLQLRIWTYMLRKAEVFPKDEIWVLDRSGDAFSPSELFLPVEDKDKMEEYEKAGLRFVDIDAYVNIDKEQDRERAKQQWASFFKNGLRIKSPMEDNKSIDIILSKIGKNAPKLNKEELLIYTKVLKELAEAFPNKQLEPIQVLTTDEEIEISDAVYFSSKYDPEQDWQRQTLVRIGPFLSDKYLETGDIKSWKDFFKKVGVRERAPSEMVEKYAIEFVSNMLGRDYVEPSHNGHDLIYSKDGVEYYIEVKGRTADIEDIKLEKPEVKTAIRKKDKYVLMIVFGVPNKPRPCCIKNPIEAIEDWYEITIPKETIKKYLEEGCNLA